jgi:hypothetical protein
MEGGEFVQAIMKMGKEDLLRCAVYSMQLLGVQ